MTDINDLIIHTGELGNGRWVAATGVSPYLCVEAESKAASLKLAQEAIGFYTSVLRDNGGKMPTPKTPFTDSTTVGELAKAAA